MEADDWANALVIHALECKNEELENELFGVQDDLARAEDKICDLLEQEAYRDETTIRRG